jgi:hypothetical protein
MPLSPLDVNGFFRIGSDSEGTKKPAMTLVLRLIRLISEFFGKAVF